MASDYYCLIKHTDLSIAYPPHPPPPFPTQVWSPRGSWWSTWEGHPWRSRCTTGTDAPRTSARSPCCLGRTLKTTRSAMSAWWQVSHMIKTGQRVGFNKEPLLHTDQEVGVWSFTVINTVLVSQGSVIILHKAISYLKTREKSCSRFAIYCPNKK